MIAAQPQLLQIPLDPDDVVYTPDWVAKDMVEFFKPSGRILEPCKGDGVFLDDGLIARFTDPNVTQVLIELRILSKSEAKSDASVGILTLPGSEAFALSCIGP